MEPPGFPHPTAKDSFDIYPSLILMMSRFAETLRQYPVATICDRVEGLPPSAACDWQNGSNLPPPWVQPLVLRALGPVPDPPGTKRRPGRPRGAKAKSPGYK